MTNRTSKRIFTLFLCLLILVVATACGADDTERIVGRWRMISFTTDGGEQPAIENELDMIFYSTGVGEAQIDGETLYMFEYTVKNGRMTRMITYSATNVVNASETYQFSDDGGTLSVYSPADGATIVLEKISDDVSHRIEVPDKSQ